jgi:hypothetical protein
MIMTSDGEWNPMVLDNIISTEPSWYAAIDAKSRDTINNRCNEVGEYLMGHHKGAFVYAHTGTVDHIAAYLLGLVKIILSTTIGFHSPSEVIIT